MARQKFEKTFNTFVKGLMTEASELNFPEDFSLYEKNFLLHRDGGRDRRKGMELVYPLGMILTSTLYPIEFEDSLAPSVVAPGVYRRTLPGPAYNDDSMSISMLAPSVSRVSAVRYLSYQYEESLGVAMLAPVVSRRSMVRTYTGEPESLAVTILAPGVSRRSHPVYTIPEEALAVAILAPTVKRTNT